MAERSNDEIWERLGALLADVQGLRRDITRSDDKASEHRDRVNERLTNLENDMAEMRPAVAGLTDLRAKAGGVILALGVVGSILGWMLGAFADQIKTFVFRLLAIH